MRIPLFKKASSLVLLGAISLAGCAQREVVVVRHDHPVEREVVIAGGGPPPPARVEVVGVAPHPGAHWVRGHWARRHSGWFWVRGYWA